MSGFSHLILSFCILGYIFWSSNAWDVKMQRNIQGLVGSCLVIPCSFDYYQYPPSNPSRVVWYQYVSHGYPVVYDSWYPNSVIDIFKGRTSRVDSGMSGKQCTLRIYPVQWSHHRQKIYPWVDPEHVGRDTYRFFDTTVTIEVSNRAKKPNIIISGDTKVGQSVKVHCIVYHTCPTNPPTLSLNIPLQRHSVTHSLFPDGTSKTILTTTMNIVEDRQTVQCSVRHVGGLTATASKTLTAECSFFPLTIPSTSDEFLEGEPSKVTCMVSYTCAKHLPSFTWNYGSMPASTDIKKTGARFTAVSTLTFTASANDNGRSLTCYAQFSGGQSMKASMTLRVKRNMLSRGWSFTTPGSIRGMRGSCIIIPCRFTYSISQPADLQVIWYLFQSNRYSPVYDERQAFTNKFSGITSLIGSVRERNCSLKIEKLEMSHNLDRLYPWIDKNPITSYHTPGHTFYDKTTQLLVSDQAQEPQLSLTIVPRVGEKSQVSCSVRHTCISAPPTLTISGINGADHTMDTLVSEGIWERKVERTWPVKEEDQTVKCTVSYHGGQTATSELRLNAECPYEEIKMSEWPGEATEGVAKSVICSVSYKCKKNRPTIVWNYKDMFSSFFTRTISNTDYIAVSNLTFIGSLEDDGNSLKCTAHFFTGDTSDSTTIHIKKYVEPAEVLDPQESDTFRVLAADVPFRFNALTHSCVVIPCSFQYQEDEPLTRGIWSKKKGGIVYHNGRSYVLDHFKDRTRIVGDLNEGNCSLEIDDIKAFDNGPFCFHAEKGTDKYRFNNSCVFIVMKASPEKPVMTQIPAEVDAGSTITVSCSVMHTCPSHPPMFSWSVANLTSEITHTKTPEGISKTTSTITFMASGGDGVKSLTCTATSWGDKQQATTVKLTVKGSLTYQLRSSLPVSIPVSALVLLVIILAAVFGVVTFKKRKDSLRPPPRPEKRRSLLDRLFRRYPEGSERPPRPEKRRSIWSRFSKRGQDEHVGWQNERKPRKSFWDRFSRRQDNTADLSVSFLNNAAMLNHSKPRFPSPKHNRRPPHSVWPEDNM